MDISVIILYITAIVLLVVSIFKDPKLTKKAIKKGWLSFVKLMPTLIPLFIIVGVLLSIVTPQTIKQVMGTDSGILGVLTGMIIGSVAFMPPFVAFPLGAELLSYGAGYPQVAAFVTTLMGVGLVYWIAEVKYFGHKAVFLRNGLAFVASFIVAIMVWGIL